MKVPLYNKKLGIVVFQEETIAKTNLEVAPNIYTSEIPEGLINKEQFEKEIHGEKSVDLNQNSGAAGNHNITLDAPPNTPIPDDENLNQSTDKEDDLVPTEKWTVPRLKEYLTLFDVSYEDSELKPAILKKAVEYYEKNVKK